MLSRAIATALVAMSAASGASPAQHHAHGITVQLDPPPPVPARRSWPAWGHLRPLTHDQWILAASGWCEGRSGGQEMITATVNVMHNRAAVRHTTAVAESLRPWQLSCWNADTRAAMYGIGRWISPHSPDGIAWIVARGVAIRESHGDLPDITHGALFYHTRAVHPRWDRAMRRVAVVGAHLFYRPRSHAK